MPLTEQIARRGVAGCRRTGGEKYCRLQVGTKRGNHDELRYVEGDQPG